eukprot:m.18611 g.18611  ORF g.18611 m.18611 type:complete len:426 (+) comp10835_c0_seq1:134-1411(+)
MMSPRRMFLIHEQGVFLEYLLWLIMGSLLGNTLFASVSTSQPLQAAKTPFTLMLGFLLGLLSSSCCALQLLLGLLGVGCAGFSTMFGPIRPAMLAMTTYFQVSMWHQYQGDRFWIYLASSVTTLVMCFTPEIIAVYNRTRGEVRALKAVGSVDIRVPSMGCEACVMAIRRASTNLPHVAGMVPNVSQGQIAFLTDIRRSHSQYNALSKTLLEAVRAAGFQDAELLGSVPHPNTKSDQAVFTAAGWQSRWIASITLGMLSSSCCLLQLLLNGLAMLDLFHMGCAGFNTVLGPLRTELRILSCFWLTLIWVHSLKTKARLKPVLASTVVTLVLMFLPELLLTFGGDSYTVFDDDGGDLLTQVKLDIVGMGCEACQVQVKSLIEGFRGVVSSNVDYETGKALIHVAEDVTLDMAGITAELAREGYVIG